MCTDGGAEFSGANACMDCQAVENAANGCCGNESAACGGNSECVALNNCVAQCTDQMCADNCGASHPNGIADFNAFVGCIFGPDGMSGACGIACGGGVPPMGCDDGGAEFTGANACADCQGAETASTGCCGAENAACNANAECGALVDCANACSGDQACVQMCGSTHPNGIADLNAVVGCLFGPQGSTGACGMACQ